ncbi:MAG: metal-sensitive transcriptional regulator [Microbacteriaceae bacterium]|nr:metal-sensitive transcriptional regulator [Microbacteriaceae bacterium]
MSTKNKEDIKAISNRLRRARGQLDSVIAAIESGASCKEVVTQLSAVSSALNRAGYKIVATAMRDCISGPTEDATFNDADALTTEDLEKLFMMLA